MYTSEKNGCDKTGNGTEAKPYKTVMAAMLAYGKEPFPSIYVDGKSDDKVFICFKVNLSKGLSLENCW